MGCGPDYTPECPVDCSSISAGLGACDPEMGCPGAPGEPPPPPAAQVAPAGTYRGNLTIAGWSGPHTTLCASETPAGFQLDHYIKIVPPTVSTGVAVFERTFPCEVISSAPTAFTFVCVNHSLPEICNAASQYWDPVAQNCDAYYERREFDLSFTLDGKHATGTVRDTRNWGGCSVRQWAAAYDLTAAP